MRVLFFASAMIAAFVGSAMAADVTQEVYVSVVPFDLLVKVQLLKGIMQTPSGQNITTFCVNWNQECIEYVPAPLVSSEYSSMATDLLTNSLAHREGKAYDVCSAGYDGAGE
jgi:opacity protein-like surface antigen